MSKVAVFATITAAEGKGDELATALEPLLAASKDEVGCLFYALHRIDGKPDELRFYELYADDAAFSAHGKSPLLAEVFGKAAKEGLLGGRPVIDVARPLGGKGV